MKTGFDTESAVLSHTGGIPSPAASSSQSDGFCVHSMNVEDEDNGEWTDVEWEQEGQSQQGRDRVEDVSVPGAEANEAVGKSTRTYAPPPSIESAKAALNDLNSLLFPKHRSSRAFKLSKPIGSNGPVQKRLHMMRSFLVEYTKGGSCREWGRAARDVAASYGKSVKQAEGIKKWARRFITNRTDLPMPRLRSSRTSALGNEDFVRELQDHLQSIGKTVRAEDIVQYLKRDDVKERYQLQATVSLSTAKRWMKALDYRWTKTPTGQYVDGHERQDVVNYRQNTFLPAMAALEASLRVWNDGLEILPVETAQPARYTVVWWHDESIFYANDRREICWVHASETPCPKRKGEGVSIMVADFVSPDYGWMAGPNGERARIFLKPGAGRDGYFTNERFLAQVRQAIEIVKTHFSKEDHVFVFDNATTHLKRPDNAISARSMPKGPSSNFGVWQNTVNDAGNVIHGPDGRVLKTKARMADGRLHDGTPQPFYFPEDHELRGQFKGMAVILEERGFANARELKAQCGKDFASACPKTPDSGLSEQRCCCRRILYNEPDFISVVSSVEQLCRDAGVQVIFLPKFHCELNCIEQCWGNAKRTYRNQPLTSSDAIMERYINEALDSIDLRIIRR